MTHVFIPRNQLEPGEDEQIAVACAEQGVEVTEYGILLQVRNLEPDQAHYMLQQLEHMGIQQCWKSEQ